jgi:cysteine synthase B
VSVELPPAPVLPSLLAAIGRTPLVHIRGFGLPGAVEVWAKCEWFNPGGSVKDRTALSLVQEGERSGALRRGKTIVDSSSGNTAVGLALVGRALGYDVELVMPASVSPERQRLCRAYGARLVFTDAFDGSDGAIVKVREMVAERPDHYFYADQYRNPANPLAHYRTTGPEVWAQTGGRITHYVAGLGTTGTIVGAGRYLHEKSPAVRVVAVEPDTELHGLEGLKHMPSSIVPEVYDRGVPDEVRLAGTDDAAAMREEILRTDGLLVGPSAGAALWTARAVARELSHGVVVVVLPDGGERYLSDAP